MRSNKTSLIILALFLFACSSESPADNNGVHIATDQGVKRDTGTADVKDTHDARDVTTNTDVGRDDTDVFGPDIGSDSGADLTPNKLRIATWNIYYLDAEGEGEKVQRLPSDYNRLSNYLAELNADLIALQEINGEVAVRTIFPASTWDFECEDRNSSQNVCVVLRKSKKWKIERHPDLISLRVGNPNLRAGLDFTISKAGYPSVRILAVHMKADCFVGDTAPGCTTFFSQIDALEAWIDERASTNEPYIVMGDFNRFMTENDSAWTEINDGMPARATLMKSVAEGNTPCWGGMFSEFIDHIILDDMTTNWLEASAQMEFDETDFDAHYKNLSDHCPLWADLTFPSL